MFGITTFSQAPFNTLGGIYASIIESITTETDSEAVVATFITSISEALSLADVINFGSFAFATENLNLADSINSVGNFSGSVSENIQPVDIPSSTAAYLSAIVEAAAYADAPSFTWNLSDTENFGLSDSATGFGTFAYSVLENIVLADNASVINAALVNIFEGISGFSDSPLGPATFATRVTEVASFIDSQAFTWNFIIIENSSIADVQTVKALFVSTIAENINPQGLATVIASFVGAQYEAMSIGDIPNVSGWVKINNSQNPAFVVINDAQSSNWVILTVGN